MLRILEFVFLWVYGEKVGTVNGERSRWFGEEDLGGTCCGVELQLFGECVCHVSREPGTLGIDCAFYLVFSHCVRVLYELNKDGDNVEQVTD